MRVVAAVVIALPLMAVLRESLGPPANQIVNPPDTTVYDTQSTTSLVLGSGSNLVVSYIDTSKPGYRSTGFSWSATGGTGWTDGGVLPNIGGLSFRDAGYPALARDELSGTTYLVTQSDAPPTFNGSGILVFRSLHDGASWDYPVEAADYWGAHGGYYEPQLAVDNFPGTGQGYVYVITGATHFFAPDIELLRSTNGGATFGNTTVVPGGAGPFVGIGPDHAVHALWFANSSIRTKKSTDFGMTFLPDVQVAALTGGGDLGLNGGFSTNSYPQAAVNRVSGDVYVVFNDKEGIDKADVFVTRSSDGGTTWSTPLTVNDDATGRDQFMPAIAVTPDGSHLFVTWYDRRSDPSNSLIEKWGVVATLSGGPGGPMVFGPNFKISTGSWPVVIGQDSEAPSRYMGYRDSAAADNRAFYTTWGDNRLPNPGGGHAHQPDVRFAKIRLDRSPHGDFDNDGRTDRTFYRPATGVWYSALSGGGATTTSWGAVGDVDVPGDFDGDGKSDIAVWRPSSGIWFIVRSSDDTVQVTTWGTSGDIPLAGDVDGDGIDDLAIYRPSAGAWFMNLSAGGTTALGWGIDVDQPLLGDFDGDGKMDPTVFRPTTGVWYSALSGGGSAIAGWGTTDDVPVVGDFDGDGKSDQTIFRPSAGEWWVNKSTGGVTVVQYGQSGDVPISGDLDDDGKSDFTVWRPGNGIWYTQLAAGGNQFLTWGTNGDKPIGRRPGS